MRTASERGGRPAAACRMCCVVCVRAQDRLPILRHHLRDLMCLLSQPPGLIHTRFELMESLMGGRNLVG